MTYDANLLRLAALKEQKIRKARTNLRDFMEYMTPDPNHYEDPSISLYECQKVHEKIITQFVRTINRDSLRSALSVPSQHGKTTICAELGLAFVAGNFPTWNIIYGTYSESRAKIVGDKVRQILESERFKDVFPEFEMRKGSKAKDLIGFEDGGSIMFLGRNSGGAGNPCNLFVIDDPYKNMQEARSPAIRAEVWSWYTSVVEQRCPASTPIFIIHTRWSDDDLIGRLCDPDHPNFDPDDNDGFEYLKLPGIIYEDQTELIQELGIELISKDEATALGLPLRAGSLWPRKRVKQKDGTWVTEDHWPVWLFMKMKTKNSTTFSAMVMSEPVPPSGDFYKAEMIKEYRRQQLPENLVIYGASDHAVSTAKRADESCIGCAGMDENGELWILPDLVWGQIEPTQQIKDMAGLIQRHKPRCWWGEGDHIKKSLLPFLTKYLRKLRIYQYFEELTKTGDKQQKSQAIRAMMSMGAVHFPADAYWYPRAKAQMLRFDGSEGRPDDFCDFLANLGRGLAEMRNARPPEPKAKANIVSGSMAWVKQASTQKKLFDKRMKAIQGW